jgi:hypothetical protein
MKRIMNFLVVLGIIGMLGLVFIPQPVSAMTGSGTVGDPYMIYNVTDLQNMADGSPYGVNASYKLANDIDASATTAWNWNAGRGVYEGFLPRSFGGHFDGNYHTISGLYINRYASGADITVGLFRDFNAAPGVTVQNVLIIDANIIGSVISTTNYCAAGILAGAWGDSASATVQHVITSGTVSATLTDTYSPGNSIAVAGGLIGFVSEGDGTIEYCASYAGVYARGYSQACAYAGGLVGDYGTFYGSNLMIRNCYARGYSIADVTDSYPGGVAGGFIGAFSPKSLGNCLVQKSYSTGQAIVIGDINPRTGGLIGDIWYNPPSDVTNCFWDTQTSGQATSNGGTGKTTSQMTTQSTFTSAGWDFDTIWAIRSPINDGYPYLLWWYTPISAGNQVVWFQPNYIIQGTELPNRTGNTDGVIHWGSNPAGVSVTVTKVNTDYTPANSTVPMVSPQDMIGPTGQQDRTADIGTLTTNPFYPLVKALSDNTGIPVQLWWIILASIIVVAAMVVTYKFLPHQMIVALVGGGLSAFFYAMGIYPFWVVLIFAVMALAIILGERSPVV